MHVVVLGPDLRVHSTVDVAVRDDRCPVTARIVRINQTDTNNAVICHLMKFEAAQHKVALPDQLSQFELEGFDALVHISSYIANAVTDTVLKKLTINMTSYFFFEPDITMMIYEGWGNK